ncbi:uncharacterized protein LOC143033695 [Oratosquilla oratoria]|uniref:uncharacterized protein LOC143033695 n=1 Tax=Oratosquilla oratoria TaxID=337810 RepID=UPI003F75A01B
MVQEYPRLSEENPLALPLQPSQYGYFWRQRFHDFPHPRRRDLTKTVAACPSAHPRQPYQSVIYCLQLAMSTRSAVYRLPTAGPLIHDCHNHQPSAVCPLALTVYPTKSAVTCQVCRLPGTSADCHRCNLQL